MDRVEIKPLKNHPVECRLYKAKGRFESISADKRFYIKRIEIIRSKTVNSKLSHKSPHYTPYTLCMNE